MQSGQAPINAPVGGSNYINERMNAYEMALLDAKRKILSAMKVRNLAVKYLTSFLVLSRRN